MAAEIMVVAVGYHCIHGGGTAVPYLVTYKIRQPQLTKSLLPKGVQISSKSSVKATGPFQRTQTELHKHTITTSMRFKGNIRPLAERYQYSPLREDAQEVRLVTLLPGTLSAPIRVDINTTRFTENNIPQLEALSYTWGVLKNPREILVGATGSIALTVTQNLAEALMCLRYEDMSRTLWVDAICVNQQDLVERSQQVKRMADIYSKASRVVVWLGPESHDTAIAMECLTLIHSKIRVDWVSSRMIPLSDEVEWCDERIHLPFDETQFLAIYNFLSRPWFERLWIWQEITLASQDSVILCGTRTMSWLGFRDAVFSLLYTPLPRLNLVVTAKLHQRLQMILNLCNGSKTRHLRSLIDATKRSTCTDPRDRIFSLLSMLDLTAGKLEIEPDYTKDVSEVFKDATIRWINYERSLQIFQSVGMEGQLAGMPSWVPSWSSPRVLTPLVENLAGANTMAPLLEHTSYQRDEIQVTGLPVGRIHHVEVINLAGPGVLTQAALASEVRRLDSFMGIWGPDLPRSMQVRIFCEVLCSNGFCDNFEPQIANVGSREQCEDIIRSILENRDEGVSIHNLFSRSIIAYCRGRSLFVGEDRRLGLGPYGIQVGDVVSVLLGCNSAVVLRPTHDGRYQIVGEAYYYGFMSGEAFLGPLPSSMESLTWHDSTQSIKSFINRETGAIQQEDPRLGDLPAPWRRANNTVEIYQSTRYVNDETGKSTLFDPRLAPNVLEARGAKLKVLRLV